MYHGLYLYFSRSFSRFQCVVSKCFNTQEYLMWNFEKFWKSIDRSSGVLPTNQAKDLLTTILLIAKINTFDPGSNSLDFMFPYFWEIQKKEIYKWCKVGLQWLDKYFSCYSLVIYFNTALQKFPYMIHVNAALIILISHVFQSQFSLLPWYHIF